MLILVCIALVVALAEAFDDRSVYNVVVLGPSGVGKSSLMNMFALNEQLFSIHNSSISQNHLATVKECHFLRKKDSFRLRLVDTQGLSNTVADNKDMDQIKNMVETIRKLEYIDLFIICLDGTNARFTTYEQRIVSLFNQIFPDFLAHSVIIFNKCTTPDDEKQSLFEREFKDKIKFYFHYTNIPCFSLDSNFYLKRKVWNDAGEMIESYLRPTIQIRSLHKARKLGIYISEKKERCDVRNIGSSLTDPHFGK